MTAVAYQDSLSLDRFEPSPVWMRLRLEEAVQVMRALPGPGGGGMVMMYDVLKVGSPLTSDDAESSDISKLRNATSVQVRRMTEVMLDWLPKLEGTAQQKRFKLQVLILRSKLIGDRPMSFRPIADILGTSHAKVRYVYNDAVLEVIDIARSAGECSNAHRTHRH